MLRADEVIATSDENLVDRVKEITNRKLAYAAVDPIAGEFTKDVAAAVRPGGTVYVSPPSRGCCSSVHDASRQQAYRPTLSASASNITMLSIPRLHPVHTSHGVCDEKDLPV